MSESPREGEVGETESLSQDGQKGPVVRRRRRVSGTAEATTSTETQVEQENKQAASAPVVKRTRKVGASDSAESAQFQDREEF